MTHVMPGYGFEFAASTAELADHRQRLLVTRIGEATMAAACEEEELSERISADMEAEFKEIDQMTGGAPQNDSLTPLQIRDSAMEIVMYELEMLFGRLESYTLSYVFIGRLGLGRGSLTDPGLGLTSLSLKSVVHDVHINKTHGIFRESLVATPLEVLPSDKAIAEEAIKRVRAVNRILGTP